MGNLHVVAATPGAISAATETVIATMTPWNENEGPAGAHGPDLNTSGASGAGAQGVYLGGSINITPASTTTVTVRVYRGASIAGGVLVGVAQVVTVTAAAVTALDIGELDPTTIQLPANYIVTVTTAAGTANVNRVLFTAEEASAFA